MDTDQIQWGSTSIEYTIERRSTRTTASVKVHPTGHVHVVAPKGTRKTQIQGLISAKAPWIWKQQERFRGLAHPAPERRFVDGESYLYLGRNYRLRVGEGANSCFARAGRLDVTVPDPTDKRQVESQIVAWYKRRAREVFARRITHFTKALDVQVPEIRIRGRSKRWGSCTDSGIVYLNWQLVAAPAPLVDYVLAHECTHLAHRQHAPVFWDALGSIMPDYPRREIRLEEEGPRFTQFT